MIFHEEFICLDRKMDFYLHVIFFVFATILLPQYSLNVNIKWGKGGGGVFQVQKIGNRSTSFGQDCSSSILPCLHFT